MGMRKTTLTIAVAALLSISTMTSGMVYANSKLNNLNEQKKDIEQKLKETKDNEKEKNVEISSIQSEQKQVDAEIKRLDLAVNDTEDKIQVKEKEIVETEAKIVELKEEIVVLTDRIAKRNDVIKNRARSYQQYGQVSYLDVLLGAKDFGDFIDRFSAVATILEADQTILRGHKEDKLALENTQAEVETTLANLELMLADLESLRKNLTKQIGDKEKLMASLKQSEEHMHAELLELEEEQELLAKQQVAIKKAIEQEKKRIEEEKRRQQSGQAPTISSGNFTRPAIGYISSGFGSRSLGNHFGVDIAASGTVPIVAAADGVVIRSYYSASYGNAVFISHSIDGQIYTTVYAHMRSRSIGEGEVVAKGQQIGIMGNTGHSYGQHLHFELHKGPWTSSKSNAISPIGIVPF